MHTLDIWSRESRNSLKWNPNSVQEPQIAVGYAGAKALHIVPQIDGKGIGLTVLDTKARKLLEIEIDPATGVVSYRVIIRNWAAARRTDGRWELRSTAIPDEKPKTKPRRSKKGA